MRTAAVFGSSGLIGSHLIDLLSANSNYQKVFSFARRKPVTLPSKTEHIDFLADSFSIPMGVDDVYICLGTTMKKAGSKEAFIKVDHDLVVQIADKSKKVGVKKLVVVSSIGANPDSSNFYLNVKGKMEEAVKRIDFEYVGIVRPSMLLGDRKEFRFGEKIGIIVFSILNFIFIGPLRKYRGILASDVAKSMILLALNGSGKVTVESNILKAIADEYK